MKVIMATKNKGKIAEMQKLLRDFHMEVISMEDAGIYIDVEEDGITFEENAAKKAETIRSVSGLCALADDSGLEVDALGGEPGVYSARYGGEGKTDAQRTQLLLENMEGIADDKRGGRFVSVVAFAPIDGETILSRGECEGKIIHEPVGENGFGYDPVFWVEEYEKTFAQISMEEKNKISHRAKALANLREKLKERFM